MGAEVPEWETYHGPLCTHHVQSSFLGNDYDYELPYRGLGLGLIPPSPLQPASTLKSLSRRQRKKSPSLQNTPCSKTQLFFNLKPERKNSFSGWSPQFLSTFIFSLQMKHFSEKVLYSELNILKMDGRTPRQCGRL